MTINTDEAKIKQLLKLGVAEAIVEKDLQKKLMSGKKLRIKLGIDPTGFNLHLGHMVVIHKLREFQELGHQIILLFGNFTGQIGDPTGKDTTRTIRTQEELENNAKDYLKQVSGILDVDKVEVRWNADWLAPLNFADVTTLCSQFTVAQMLERDMFQDRIAANKPISVHEFLYPLMQGYDSVALEADVELGGTDQTFNLLAGRKLQEAYGQAPQNIMTVPILVGTDGTIKMGKSTGNYIAVADKAEEMFGKTMSIPDELIMNYFELAARANKEKLTEVQKRLSSGENPRDIKMELGRTIVELYHDEASAVKAEEHFKTLFQKKALPDEIEEQSLEQNEWKVIDLIKEIGFAQSGSEARRLVEGGGVKVNGEKVQSIDETLTLSEEFTLIQVGKRKFKNLKGA